MKALALLLAFFCIFDSVFPCCTDDCDDTYMEYDHQKDEEGGADELCSPFLSCGNCTGFVPMIQQTEEQPALQVPISTRTFGLSLQFINSEYTYKVWQPPKQIIVHP